MDQAQEVRSPIEVNTYDVQGLPNPLEGPVNLMKSIDWILKKLDWLD